MRSSVIGCRSESPEHVPGNINFVHSTSTILTYSTLWILYSLLPHKSTERFSPQIQEWVWEHISNRSKMQLETGQFQDGLGEQPSHPEKGCWREWSTSLLNKSTRNHLENPKHHLFNRTFISFSVMNNSHPLEIFHLDIFDRLINRTFPDSLFLKQPHQ